MNLTASTSAPVTPDAGNTVAVVARGNGGSGSPRPKITLASPKRTTATRISTTRYSNTKVTPSILPDGSDSGPDGTRAAQQGRSVFIGGRSSSDTADVRGV